MHEGPQAISKFNKIKIREGMILSNEPGYYKKNKFGIRIENLMYVKKNKNKLYFENLTLAPIDKDLINFNLLTNNEKNYLLKYNINIYSKLYKHLNISEKKWLASFIHKLSHSDCFKIFIFNSFAASTFRLVGFSPIIK